MYSDIVKKEVKKAREQKDLNTPYTRDIVVPLETATRIKQTEAYSDGKEGVAKVTKGIKPEKTAKSELTGVEVRGQVSKFKRKAEK